MKKVILTFFLLIALATPPSFGYADRLICQEPSSELYDTECCQDSDFIDQGYSMIGWGVFFSGLICLLVCLIPPSPADPVTPAPPLPKTPN